MPLDTHPYSGCETSNGLFHRLGLHTQHLEQEPGVVGQTGYACGEVAIVAESGFGGIVYLLGFVGWSEHNHVGKHLIAPHDTEHRRVLGLWLDYELLAEKPLAVGSPGLACHRQNVVVEYFGLVAVLTSAGEYLAVE